MPLVACTATPPPALGTPPPLIDNSTPLALGTVWSLERLGPSPVDTSVRFAPLAGRTIVIRHPRPDNAIFAIVTFPPGAMLARRGDSVTVWLRPEPGRYGMVIESEDFMTGVAVGTFSYAVHFAEPDGALSRYPTPARFEAAIRAARRVDSASLRFLSSERPAGDMLRFPIARPGSYFLAAPR